MADCKKLEVKALLIDLDGTIVAVTEPCIKRERQKPDLIVKEMNSLPYWLGAD